MAIASVLLAPFSGSAIIFHSSGDPTYNTNAPTGALSASGWDLQGQWGNYLGTPIAPNLFITAKHVGGAVGTAFRFRGENYITIDSFVSADSDLRVYRVCGTFPEFAPLYDATDEVGRELVVFGRGTQRGEAVMGDSLTGPELKGWKWGPTDRVQRWGENVVSDVQDGGEGVGELLAIDFDRGAGENEGHLSSGDSGGAVFIQEEGIWKLAGINYAVDGPYNTTNTGGGFQAAIFDEGGLHTQPEDETWEPLPDLPLDQPGAFYATRISSNLDWIQAIVDLHGGVDPPVLESAPDLGSSFQIVPSYVVDEATMTITLPVPEQPMFLRLIDCSGVDILSTRIIDGQWVITYGPRP